MIKIGTLFSGIGAQEEAFKEENVDIDLKFFCDYDPEEKTQWASKAYSLIHGVSEDLNLGDICQVDETKLSNVDILTSSFPCQSFSMQGKRLGFDDPVKGNMFFETARIAKEIKPKILIIENVKGLTNHDKGNTLNTILETLDFLGYNNYYKVLNSVNFNLSQSRERLFLVAIRKDIDNGKFKISEGEMTSLTVNDILDEFPRKEMKENLKPYNNYEYFTKNYVSKNGTVKLFDGCSEGYFTSSFCSNRIYSTRGVSPTLTTKNDTVYHEIEGHLTSRERFALQGFKKEYADLLKENGFPKGKIDKISGNTLPVNIFRSIIRDLQRAKLI